ncbi:ABC transporter permease subunit [Herbaspirillum sp. RTI4]|nr:ABC transporter permease subunit [Herbaspirillum sp. RTI4]MDY7578821.1 ABC transporter permease subunit [Herbaspirillum sp. RTI4]MEA9982675.1 ABC transporter permease subunit [Herbaspirillum sp. RTI4]
MRRHVGINSRWLGLPFPLLLLLLWYVAAQHEWVAPQVLPSPQSVALTFIDLARSGELFDNLQISLIRVLAGFGIGLVGGLLLGVAMGLSPLFKDYVYPLFKAFSQVPVLGWLPLLMLLVGIDEALKIILISQAALVPIALNTYKGLENVPARYVEVARVLTQRKPPVFATNVRARVDFSWECPLCYCSIKRAYQALRVRQSY